MDQAAERFARAIRGREPVAVFGDYDVDGAASVALVARFLRAHGQEPVTYIPDRLTEGYGPSPTSLAGLAEDGARLILTVDCGTTAGAATAAAIFLPSRRIDDAGDMSGASHDEADRTAEQL